jgi:hypothetical protein
MKNNELDELYEQARNMDNQILELEKKREAVFERIDELEARKELNV